MTERDPGAGSPAQDDAGRRSDRQPGRMTGSWFSARIAACALLVAAAAACGSDDKPAVCGDLDQLKSSVQSLRDVQVEKGALTKVKEDAAQIRQQLGTLEADAKSQFSTEITRLRSELTSLSASLDAATASPTAASLAALGVAARDTVGAGQALASAVGDTC